MIMPCAELMRVRSGFAEHWWAEQAHKLYWQTPFTKVMERIDGGPRCLWFADGTTNLCYNALDRHLPEKGAQTALIHCAYDGQEQHFSYYELHREVQALSWELRERGVRPGDRVLICLPAIPQAAIAMLACARLGAVHVVVYSGMTLHSLAQRIIASEAKVIISYQQRRGQQPLPPLTEACELAGQNMDALMWLDSDDYAEARARVIDQPLACHFQSAAAPSHLLYTSGTTGQPKGIVRDTGGYAVALLASMEKLFRLGEEEVIFTSADIGWVTGHSYGIYAPLLAGITTLMVEASPLNKPGKRWWQLIARHKVTRLLTIPGAMRLARQAEKEQGVCITYLRGVFLAGEPLDAPTRQWVSERTGAPVEDHYWQTESGWPLLAGIEGRLQPVEPREVAVVNPETGTDCVTGEPGVLLVRNTLGPGGMLTLWKNDPEHDQLYWRLIEGEWWYCTHDQAVRTENNSLRILGRMDDVINIGGKRLSTSEVEQAVIPIGSVAEVAAVGIAHSLLGQMVALYVVTPLYNKQALKTLKREITTEIVRKCGRHALPRHIVFVSQLPRTFSGKIMRNQLEKCG